MCAEKNYRGLFWDDFDTGQEFHSPGRTVTETDIVLFAGLSGDFNPLHMDEEFARQSSFGNRIAHGALIQSLMTGMIAQLGIFEGTTVALRRLDSKFKNTVCCGDTLFATITVVEKKILKGRQGLVHFSTRVKKHDDRVVADGRWTLLLQTRPDDCNPPAS